MLKILLAKFLFQEEAEAAVGEITVVDSGKVQAGVAIKAAELAGVVALLVMDQDLVLHVFRSLKFNIKCLILGGNSWAADYDNGYGGNMREFSQGGGPVRNSYVTERSVPYTRDYGGKILSLKKCTNLFQLPGK